MTDSAERAARRIALYPDDGISRADYEAKFEAQVKEIAAIIREELAREQPKRICGNCGLPLEEGETEEICREVDAMSERLRKARSSAQPKGEGNGTT